MEKKIMKIKSCVISGQRNLKENICRFFTGKKIYIGNYSDRTRADISYCHSASVDL